MARKTFISYKHSEAQELRDKIIDALGTDASYYTGETSDSPDMTDLKTETIRTNLSDMIFNTSVTIVIISPNIKKSKWIDWEIAFSLKNTTRNERTSKTNGVVAVIQKVDDSYSWFKEIITNIDNCTVAKYKEELVYDIIKNNRYNKILKEYSCSECKTTNGLTGSYISYINEQDFLNAPNDYIENAYEKSQSLSNYTIVKER